MKQHNDENLTMMQVKWKWEKGRRKTITSHIKSNIYLHAHTQKRHDRHTYMHTRTHARTLKHTHTHRAHWWSRQRHTEAAVLHIFIHHWMHTILMFRNFNTKYIPSRLSNLLKTN